MQSRIITVFCFLTLVFINSAIAQTAVCDKIGYSHETNGIKFSIFNLTVKGMKGKQISFSFWLSQDGEWLSESYIGLEPQQLKYDPAYWEGDSIWFSYDYSDLKKWGDPDRSFWGSFFVQETRTNKVLLQKDIEFNIYDEGGETISGTQSSDTAASGGLFRDDFSRDNLDDMNHYVRFGPSYMKVQGGVLRMEINSNKWNDMELLNIFPCLGGTSRISFRARWAGGDGASLFIGTDWRYRHSGRRTHFYIDFNSNRVVAWNTEGVASQEMTFKKGEWINVSIERKIDVMTLYVNNHARLTKKLDALSATENIPAEAGYGGYFLETDTRPYLQIIELDDLQLDGEPSPVEYKAKSRGFTLDKKIDTGAYRFSVIYEQGMETWAEGQLDVSIPYIRAAAGIYGIPPMSRSLGMVSSRGMYYDGGAGYNSRGVVYQKANNEFATALNTHELAHNWYAYYGKKWITESSADFCHFANLENSSKRLITAADFLFNLERYSAEDYLKGAEDFYLDNEDMAGAFFSGGMPQWDIINKTAWKQRVFFYMLYRILGDEGFRRLHAMAAALDHGMTSRECRSFAEKIKGKDLAGLFNGWVFPGKTAYPPAELFVDNDGDGLSDLDERIFGTNPLLADTDKDGYGDRGEIAAGYSPLDKKSPAAGCIVVDGLATDWSGADTVVDARDAAGSEDLKSVSFVVDSNNGLLNVLFQFWNSLPQPADSVSWNYYATCDIDTDNDNNFDYRVNLFYNKNNVSNAFRTNGFTGAKWDSSRWTSLDSSGVVFVYRPDGMLEASVPLALLDNAKSVRISVNTGSPAGSDTLEKAPVSVKASSMPRFPAAVWKPN